VCVSLSVCMFSRITVRIPDLNMFMQVCFGLLVYQSLRGENGSKLFEIWKDFYVRFDTKSILLLEYEK